MQKIVMFRGAFEGGGVGARVSEASFVGLGRGVVMGVHDNGIFDVNDLPTFLLAPERVFVVFGVLEFFQKPALRPNIPAQSAADHAEKMGPGNRFAVGSKTAVIITGVNRLAIGAGDLSPKNGGGLRV